MDDNPIPTESQCILAAWAVLLDFIWTVSLPLVELWWTQGLPSTDPLESDPGGLELHQTMYHHGHR